MERLARLTWVIVPAWTARVSRSLAFAIGDGAELGAIPFAGALIPLLALALGFGCARAIPGYDSAFTGSLVLTCAMLVAGASAGAAGWWCVVGFVLGDFSAGHHPYLARTAAPVHLAGLAISYGILFGLVVGVPRVARALAASVVPRRWTVPRAVLAALAGGALAYTWSQAAAVLIRPLFVFAGDAPPTDAIQPTQTHPASTPPWPRSRSVPRRSCAPRSPARRTARGWCSTARAPVPPRRRSRCRGRHAPCCARW